MVVCNQCIRYLPLWQMDNCKTIMQTNHVHDKPLWDVSRACFWHELKMILARLNHVSGLPLCTNKVNRPITDLSPIQMSSLELNFALVHANVVEIAIRDSNVWNWVEKSPLHEFNEHHHTILYMAKKFALSYNSRNKMISKNHLSGF